MAISRSGSYLVVSRATSMLPAMCIKCGEPGAKTIRKTYLWHHPALYLLIFLCSPLIYVIIASSFGKKMPLGISLCKRHAGRRLVLLLAGTLLLLGGIPLGIVVGGNAGVAVGAIGVLAGLVVLVVATNTIRPVKMTETEATYTGLGESFLSRYPAK